MTLGLAPKVLVLLMPSGLSCVASGSTCLSVPPHLPSLQASTACLSRVKATSSVLGSWRGFHFWSAH